MSNGGTVLEQCSVLLEYHLKKIMQKCWSCIKDSEYFIEKINNLDSAPENAILVTADVVGLYPSTPHDLGLTALRGALD